MNILRARDANGKWMDIPAIKGDKGDTGNSGVYLGSGEMPDDCNVQIDPEGVAVDLQEEIAKVLREQKKVFELIETITLTEDVSTISRTQEPDGTPYNFEAVYIKCEMTVAEKSSYLSATFYPQGITDSGNALNFYIGNGLSTSNAKTAIYVYGLHGHIYGMFSNPVPNTQDAPNYWKPPLFSRFGIKHKPIWKITFTGGVVLPTGSTIEIWGVRK